MVAGRRPGRDVLVFWPHSFYLAIVELVFGKITKDYIVSLKNIAERGDVALRWSQMS